MGRASLPWPPKSLSPNSRKDRRHSTADRKAYKKACWALAKEAKLKGTHLTLTFHPPCGRRRDLDNMLSHCKYAIDGIALAMGVDDSEFSYTIHKGEPDRPQGRVEVVVE